MHETADGGVGGIFGKHDVVLRVEIADVESGVEDDGAIGESERLFDNVEFVVNFADELFDEVFDGDQSRECCRIRRRPWPCRRGARAIR